MMQQEIPQRRYTAHEINHARGYLALAVCLGVTGLVMLLCTSAYGGGYVLLPLVLCVLPACCALVAMLSKFPALHFGNRIRAEFRKCCLGCGSSEKSPPQPAQAGRTCLNGSKKQWFNVRDIGVRETFKEGI